MSAGYFWDKRRRKYVVQLRRDNKLHYVGQYDTPEEATEARTAYLDQLAADESATESSVEENRASLAYWFFSRGRLSRDGDVMALIGGEP